MKRSSKYIITLGFGLIVVMILALSGTALHNMSAAHNNMQSIVEVNNVKVALVTQLRNAARDRSLILHRITLMNDPFDVDAEILKYSQSAVDFREALDRFRAMPLDTEERKVLADALDEVRIGQRSQDQVMSLFQAQRKQEANTLLLEETIAAQENVFTQLNKLLKLQRDATDLAFARTANRYRVAYSLTSALAAGVIGVAILIAWFVIRRSSQIESELHREKEFAEVTLKSIADGVITTDTDGKISFINPIAVDMSNIQNQGILGMPVMHVLGIGNDNPQQSFTHILADAEAHPFRQGLEVGNGDKARNLELSLSPMRGKDGHITGSVLVLHDMTEARRSAEQLRQLNATLEEKVIERTHALSATNQELQQAIATLHKAQGQLVHAEKMASLGNLVAGISHEINTPLGIGVTSASSLQIEVANLTARFASNTMKRSDLQEFLDHANQACNILLVNMERAANLIRSFKQVAVDQTSDDWRELNVRDYFEEILTSLRPRLKHATVVVENLADPTLVCHTHPGAIFQIMSNLILNALTHAYEPGQGGAIRISARRDGSHIVLTCQDDGKGISDVNISHIFEPFFTTKRGSGGTGLGLNVAYNLVTTRLQGVISVASTLNQGTTFTVRLPDMQQPPEKG